MAIDPCRVSCALGQRFKREWKAKVFSSRALALSLAICSWTTLGLGKPHASSTELLQEIQQLIQKGDVAQARRQLTQMLTASPDDPNALNLLGVVDAQEGKYRAAESDFQKAIAKAPHFTGAYLNLGRLYQENAGKDPGALKKAAGVYEQVLDFEPANLEATYQSALVLWRLGSFKVSLDRLSQLPAEAQTHPQALLVRCGDYAGLNDLPQAERAADQLLKRPDLSQADVFTLLPSLLARHHEELAVRLLEGLDQRGLASTGVLEKLASLYESRGKFDRARATLERAAQLQNFPVPLLVKLARLAYKQGDYEGALGYLAHARDLEPNNAGVHFFFGLVCVEMNLVQEAYTSLQKAVELNPGNPYYNYALGAVMMARQNVREAYPYLKKYCTLKPEDPRGRLALGAAYFYGHDPELALQELESVLKYPKTAAPAHYFLGRLANQKGDFAGAMKELEQAIKLHPQYDDAYAELGLLYMKQKEYAKAEESLQKALGMNPDNYTANLNLMILYQRTKDPRADAQTNRFEKLRKTLAEREKEFLRTIEVRP
jgi:tetratricopeptide (TPR) repeat protein